MIAFFASLFTSRFSWLVTAAAFALAFMSGLAVGNVWATRKALEVAQEHSDKMFHDATQSMWKSWDDSNKALSAHLAEDAKRGRTADDNAVATITKARDAARGDADKARAQLIVERALRPASQIPMEAANACPAPEPFTFSPDARRLLDNAAGAVAEPAASPANASGTETASGMLEPATGR